jgi:hypothetical protein
VGSASAPVRPGSAGAVAGSASAGAAGAATGAASVGSASVGTASGVAPLGAPAAAGAASVGAASVGSASVGSASVGSASVGSASVGSASVGSASVGSASVGAGPGGGASSLDRGNSGSVRAGAASAGETPGVPQAGSPSVGARVGAAKAAGSLPESVEAGLRAQSPSETMSGLRGAGTELRTRLRTRRRLRLVSLLSLAGVVLVLLPLIFGVRASSHDPVFSSLDSLDVPSWASVQVDDQSSGSKWCFLECRFRERIAQSDKPFKETTAAYTAALSSAGWEPWKVGECPDQPVAAKDGTYSCWKRDEFTLDLWVRLPECAVDQVAAQDPALATSVPSTPAKKCVGSTVSIKVQNAVTDLRGKPAPQESPLIGETPDAVISDDPLLQPTPTAS